MVERKWQFKTKFRAKAFGWRGSRLAISRLKEAVSEIKAVAKSDPVAAGDGAVSLMERIWPAFQDIDTSSGALGTAVARTLAELIPDPHRRYGRSFDKKQVAQAIVEAVHDDGVQYLSPVENRFGEIARYPDLTNAFADELLPLLRQVWSDQKHFEYVSGTAICLSCLLEAGRYAELAELLAKQRMKFWSWQRFGAEALLRQGRWEEAVAFADSVRDAGHDKISIDLFCEKVLIHQGRSDEAYRRFGLGAATGTTNLAIYRSLVRTYPERNRRQLLLDLIKTRGDKGKWFAAAKDAGFLDIALECAALHNADPSTLVRAARDFCGKEPKFAATVALFAVTHLLTGGGYDPPVSDVNEAVKHLFAAARQIGAVGWAHQNLGRLVASPCIPGREIFQQTAKVALSRYDAETASP
jgi:hypothetical protein